MTTAEGRVPTTRADRYLDQLCGHLGQMAHHGPPDHRADSVGTDARGDRGRRHGHTGPPAVKRVDRDGSVAHIVFDWGTCDLTATDTELTLEVDAADPEAQARGQQLLQQRIETIGRRDQLTVTWNPTRI